MRLTVTLTDAERAEIERRADLYGVTLSDYVRSRALGASLPPSAADQATRAALTTALLRIGVNLNQITKHMNAGRSAPFHLPELLNDIRGPSKSARVNPSRGLPHTSCTTRGRRRRLSASAGFNRTIWTRPTANAPGGSWRPRR